MKNKLLIILSALLCFLFRDLPVQAQVGLINLRCELLVNPKGIDYSNPRLSWEITGNQRGIKQTAYHILVASSVAKLNSNVGDLWDSKRVPSDKSVFVAYEGQYLKSRTACFWKVQVSTNAGATGWSKPANWTMGLLNKSDWNAKWIGLDKSFPGDQPDSIHTRLAARYLRKEFVSSRRVKNATMYISGLGLYELYINGAKIGKGQVLSPSPTDYTKSVKYNTFNVTGNINQGSNAIGVILGNGRFFAMRHRENYYPPGRHWLYNNKNFGFPKMIAQLEIEFADGSKQTVISDDAWKVTAAGPIVSNSEFDGEEYDARKEMPGWSKTGFNDGSWLKAEEVKDPGGELNAQINRNIKVMQLMKPRSIRQIVPGTFIMDMGQNMVGWLQMKVKGERGQSVKLRFAETLEPDGALYMANIREAFVTDKYTLKGSGAETWEPRFTYHGFRYVEITGYPGTPTVDDFEGRVVYDEMENTGTFSTSDTTINQIYHNAYWGIRSNYRGFPTDCPQRDERMGWLGDRTTGALGESYIFNNHALYAKWLDDIEQAQLDNGSIPDVAPNYWDAYNDNMTWPAAYINIAEMLYEQYGDLQPIGKHYASMKKWMDYMRKSFMVNHIMTRDSYGDWCMPPEKLDIIFSEDPKRKTDGTLIGTAFYYRLAGMMANFAALLNKTNDADDFTNQAREVKAAFNKKYFNADSLYYGNNTVTANLIPLCFNLVPAQYENDIVKHISDRTEGEYKSHVSVGLIGIQWLMRGLSAHGHADLAFKIATNQDYPGWGYMVSQGATTIWELWNGNTADPSMNSGNHVMLLGDLIAWDYQCLAGIKNKDGNIGFKQIEMSPYFIKGLNHVTACYQSVHGLIKSAWQQNANTLHWQISVPNNTTATVTFPVSDKNKITENRVDAGSIKGVKFIKADGGHAVFTVEAGNYNFIVKQ